MLHLKHSFLRQNTHTCFNMTLNNCDMHRPRSAYAFRLQMVNVELQSIKRLFEHNATIKCFILWGNRGGLSLTSVSVMFTVVVPDNPPIWPPMSFAWMTTWYSSLFSLLMSGKAVLMTPCKKKRHTKKTK